MKVCVCAVGCEVLVLFVGGFGDGVVRYGVGVGGFWRWMLGLECTRYGVRGTGYKRDTRRV